MYLIKNLIAHGAKSLQDAYHLRKNQIATTSNQHTLESRLILQSVLKLSLTELLSTTNKVNQQQFEQFNNLLKRRIQLEPLEYITGIKEFYGLDLEVDSSVLIPRHDSEILIDAILKKYQKISNLKILDLGTGSGALSIALAKNLITPSILSTDISSAALKIANKNAIKHQVTEIVKLIQSDWFKNIDSQKFDIIISNPPYISRLEQSDLTQEVLNEPHIALFADNNGLSAYQEIANNAMNYLQCNGEIFVEIGFTQAEDVKQIFQNHNFTFLNSYKDLQGHNRCIRFAPNIINRYL